MGTGSFTAEKSSVRVVVRTESSVTPFPLPVEVADRLRQFLLDKRNGNFQLNIRQGVILGFHVNEIHTL